MGKFIGHLFLRKLLAMKVICQVASELIGKQPEELPAEHKVECTCELLKVMGHGLENIEPNPEQGKRLMSQFLARLLELKRSKLPSGSAAYSKRVQFQIQDLLDLQQRGWSAR